MQPGNAPCVHVDGEFCDKCYTVTEKKLHKCFVHVYRNKNNLEHLYIEDAAHKTDKNSLNSFDYIKTISFDLELS